MDFNPLSPCGERQGKDETEVTFTIISTHSLRVERDAPVVVPPGKLDLFQPTLSVWRETIDNYCKIVRGMISTHSLRVERDLVKRDNHSFRHGISTHSLRVERDPFLLFSIPPLPYFNPLSPCGERPPRYNAFTIFK